MNKRFQRKIILQIMGVFLILSGMTLTYGQSDKVSTENAIETRIEDQIRKVISGSLRPEEYYVYANVQVQEATTTKQNNGTQVLLPFSPLSIDKQKLEAFFQEKAKDIASESTVTNLTVTLGIDSRIPEAKRNLVEKMVRERFAFDGTSRILTVESQRLVTSPVIPPTPMTPLELQRVQAEKAKIENEKLKMSIENEKMRLDMQKRELELLQKTSEFSKKEAEFNDMQIKESLEGKSLVEIIAQFQLLILGMIGGFILLVGVLLFSGSYRKGSGTLASSISSIGAALENAAKKFAPSTSASISTKSEEAGDSKEKKKEQGLDYGQGGLGGGAAAAIAAASEDNTKEEAEFIEQVQDKITILTKKKNFNFYRHFIDMIEDDEQLPFATSLLLAVDNETTKELLMDISPENIARIQSYLTKEGGLNIAKKIRKRALKEFYGKIAMDEFMGSPLMEIKDLTWLTQMNNKQILTFIMTMTDEEKPIFLACLTPPRVQKMIESITNDNDREIIVKAVSRVPFVRNDEIVPLLSKLALQMSGTSAENKIGEKAAVDGARYLAFVAEKLPFSEQQNLMNSIKDQKDLLMDVFNYFIPFYAVSMLPKKMISEIFVGRGDREIAEILFDTSKEVRLTVLDSLPSIRAATVEDELRVLDEDQLYRKRNLSKSQKLQKRISEYLLNLSKEGMLSFDNPDDHLTGNMDVSSVA